MHAPLSRSTSDPCRHLGFMYIVTFCQQSPDVFFLGNWFSRQDASRRKFGTLLSCPVPCSHCAQCHRAASRPVGFPGGPLPRSHLVLRLQQPLVIEPSVLKQFQILAPDFFGLFEKTGKPSAVRFNPPPSLKIHPTFHFCLFNRVWSPPTILRPPGSFAPLRNFLQSWVWLPVKMYVRQLLLF